MNSEEASDIKFNVTYRLDEYAALYPDKTILIAPRKVRSQRTGEIEYSPITFAQFQSSVNRLANSLADLGLHKGDKVVVMVPISIDLYIIMISLLKMGAVAVFIDSGVGVKQTIHCCKITRPTAVIGIRKFHFLRIISKEIRRIPIKIITSEPKLWGEITLRSLLSIGSDEFRTEAVGKEYPALITFTTGSTGIPKGVNRTHGFLLAQNKVLSRNIKLTPKDVDLPALPIFVLKNIANNICSVIPLMNFSRPSAVNPKLILQQFSDWKVTTSIGSPAFYEPIARYCLKQNITLGNIRTIFTGGGPVSPELIEMLTKILVSGKAYVVYGSTEAEPISLINAQEILNETAALTKKGYGNCVGVPVDDIEVRIIKINDGPVDFRQTTWDAILQHQGSIGEIVVTGEHVNKDYYKNPEAVRENKFKDEKGKIWHRTNDAGYFDTKGRLWFVGRTKSRVIRAGQEIHPLQIEPLVNQLPFVKKSALIGITNRELGQKAVLVVESMKRGLIETILTRKQWKIQISDLCLKKGLKIDEIYFCKHIPVDPRHNAKIDYEKIKRRYM